MDKFLQGALQRLESGWEDASEEKAGESSEKEVEGINAAKGEDNGCHTYDIPQAVQGSWAYNYHQHLITTYDGERAIDSKQRDMVREVSEYVDKNTDTKDYNVLHARGQTNYVSATYCLFEAARRWGGSITTQMQLANWMNNYQSNVSNSEHADYRKKVIIHLTRVAERATTRIIEKSSSKAMPQATTKAIRHDNIIRGRMQLLGFAIHLAGDVYAHKSMCVTDKFASIADTTFKNGNTKKKPSQCFTDQTNGARKTIGNMLDIIKQGNLTTAALGKSYFYRDDYWLANHAYTDSIDYMPQRYNVATKNATNYMLKNYCKNVAFSFYTFCPLKTNSGYHYKTKYLKKYLTQTVERFYNNYSDYTVSQWEALSHD